MNLRVGFAGAISHKANDPALSARLESVFTEIAGAFEAVAGTQCGASAHGARRETVLQAHIQALPECAPRAHMTLLTGYAEGADRLAVSAWRELALGHIHAVFPFAATDGESEDHAYTHRDPLPTDGSDAAYRIELRPSGDEAVHFEAITVLDGDARQEERPPRSGHLGQSRFLVRWADVLVVAWDGSAAKGPGGTADVVALALTKKSPLIWIDLATPDLPIRYLDGRKLWSPLHFGEFLDAIQLARAPGQVSSRDELAPVLDNNQLSAHLTTLFCPPQEKTVGEHDGHEHAEPSEVMLRHEYTSLRGPTLPGLWWLAELCSFAWNLIYRRGGTPSGIAPGDGPDTIPTNPVIDAHFAKADAIALRIGNGHRGTQLVILLIAAVAVFFATLPAIFKDFKFTAVVIELVLVIIAHLLHRLLKSVASHRVWSDARRLAERLRIMQATWPLGFDVADSTSDAPETWTEWYARAVRRAGGPPTGVLWARNQRDVIRFACLDRSGIVGSQAGYHALTAHRSLRLHKCLERWEPWLFAILAATLFGYTIWDSLHTSLSLSPPNNAVKGVVMVLSAVLPVIAAVMLAIEAKFGLKENGMKATALHGKFDSLRRGINAAETLSRKEELLQEAGWIFLNDVDQWRDGAVRRSAASI